jgi:hypothetical protein
MRVVCQGRIGAEVVVVVEVVDPFRATTDSDREVESCVLERRGRRLPRELCQGKMIPEADIEAVGVGMEDGVVSVDVAVDGDGKRWGRLWSMLLEEEGVFGLGMGIGWVVVEAEGVGAGAVVVEGLKGLEMGSEVSLAVVVARGEYVSGEVWFWRAWVLSAQREKGWEQREKKLEEIIEKEKGGKTRGDKSGREKERNKENRYKR